MECLLISEDIIQKIKDENDIVDVVSETVKLKRSGRNYTGLCPFHNEKTPSFSVAQDKQIFKCFGCGEGGNVFTFVMMTRKLNYVDAIKYLADRVNIVIEENDGNKSKDSYEKLYKINTEAAKYFFSNLNKYPIAKNYLLNRGITNATIRKFGLGYSLDDWNSLQNYLQRRGYTELDLLTVGLLTKNEKGNVYDRFRNRIMFPVFDIKGRVIGFGGRVLDDSKPKYLNSPETSIFKKGTNLYGFNFSLKSTNLNCFLIVEGYMDCISLHQSGINSAVASLGTALTINQAKLIKRYTDKVIISYDSDLAGQSATLRGLEILRKEGLDVRVLKVPTGKDPDDYIREKGKDSFIQLMESSLPLIDYRIKRAAEGINFKDFNNNPNLIIAYVKRIADILTELDPIEKDIFIKKVSEETGIKEQSFIDLLKDEKDRYVNKLHNMNIKDEIGQKLYTEPLFLKAERSILGLMLKNEEIYNYIQSNIQMDDLIVESHKEIFNNIIQRKGYINENQKIIESHCNTIESSKEWVNIIELKIPYKEYDYKKLIDDYLKEIKKFKFEEKKKSLMSKIKELEGKGIIDESMKYAKELINLQKEIGDL